MRTFAHYRRVSAASIALLILLGGYSLSPAQQTAGTDEESLAMNLLLPQLEL